MGTVLFCKMLKAVALICLCFALASEARPQDGAGAAAETKEDPIKGQVDEAPPPPPEAPMEKSANSEPAEWAPEDGGAGDAVEKGEEAARGLDEEGAKAIEKTEVVEKAVRDDLEEQEKEEIKE